MGSAFPLLPRASNQRLRQAITIFAIPEKPSSQSGTRPRVMYSRRKCLARRYLCLRSGIRRFTEVVRYRCRSRSGPEQRCGHDQRPGRPSPDKAGRQERRQREAHIHSRPTLPSGRQAPEPSRHGVENRAGRTQDHVHVQVCAPVIALGVRKVR